jgi:pyrroline-5-carboxylate reductase
MKLGFIGTGKITSSIVHGIFKSNLKSNKIFISHRNKAVSKSLKNKFRSITILKDNQEIIDKCNIVVLAITPTTGAEILKNLKFNNKKKIISLISTINLNGLKKLTGSKNITRVIPLPPIEIKQGPIVIFPPNKFVKQFFSHLGSVIEVKNEKLLNNFWSTSALMAPYYELLNVSTNWLAQKGINKNEAVNYITELFYGLSKDALNKKGIGLKQLVSESQTPKGINEQALRELKKSKFYSKLNNTLNSVHKRMSKAK